jgi:hypothetical protein
MSFSYLTTKTALSYLFEIFVFFAVFVCSTSIASADLQATISVSKRRMTRDETVTLTITLKGPGVERLRMPDPFPPSFTLIDKSDKPSLSQDAYGRPVSGRILRYNLRPTASGRFRVGEFSINHGGTTQKIAGEMVEVTGRARRQTGSTRPAGQAGEATGLGVNRRDRACRASRCAACGGDRQAARLCRRANRFVDPNYPQQF